MVMTRNRRSSHSQLACGAADGLPDRSQHDQIGERHAEAAERHLGDGRRLGAGAACRAHSISTNGVKAKIMNGLNAWNQVTGISPCQISN